ncbi:MAG: hypothetical protein GX580_17100 [Candidatus Hydrogenedens sp.]|nr:hypothetical protein [Candidatus Hydrogenedens sp.]
MRMGVMGMAVLLGARMLVAAEPVVVTDQTTNAAVALVNQAGVDAALLARVAKQMEADLNVGVCVFSLEACDNGLTAMRRSRATPRPVFCRVVFWKGDGGDFRESLQLSPDAKVALVDVSALLGDAPDGDRLAGRLQRQAVRGVGLLLGMSYVRGPPCILQRAATVGQLDKLSRNFSPPASGEFMLKIQLEGVNFLSGYGE